MINTILLDESEKLKIIKTLECFVRDFWDIRNYYLNKRPNQKYLLSLLKKNRLDNTNNVFKNVLALFFYEYWILAKLNNRPSRREIAFFVKKHIENHL